MRRRSATMPSTMRPDRSEEDAERPGRHSHAERFGKEKERRGRFSPARDWVRLFPQRRLAVAFEGSHRELGSSFPAIEPALGSRMESNSGIRIVWNLRRILSMFEAG